jgi:hypothetical protein
LFKLQKLNLFQGKNLELQDFGKKLLNFKNKITFKTSFKHISMLLEEILYHVFDLSNLAKNSLLIGGDGRYLTK